MCGRFFLAPEEEEKQLQRMLAEADRYMLSLTGQPGVARGEIRPSQAAAALARSKSGDIKAFPMLWGFHKRDGKGLIINTRSETAMDKPLFRAPMAQRRCLIPASWYIEWARQEEVPGLLDNTALFVSGSPLPGKQNRRGAAAFPSVPYAIRPKASRIMYLAGIYRYEAGLTLPVFSVLTREAAPGIAFIHPRMPVIFGDPLRDAWLSADENPLPLLAQCETDMQYAEYAG